MHRKDTTMNRITFTASFVSASLLLPSALSAAQHLGWVTMGSKTTKLCDIDTVGLISNSRSVSYQSNPNFGFTGISLTSSGIIYGHTINHSGNNYSNHLMYIGSSGTAGVAGWGGTGAYCPEGDSAIDPTSGLAYVVDSFGRLFRLPIAGGAATLVGTIPGVSDASAAVFSAAGQLYVLDLGSGGRLLTINKSNATISQTRVMNGLIVGSGNAAMQFDPNNAAELYAIVPVFNGSITQHLVKIDVATAATWSLGQILAGGWPTTDINGLVLGNVTPMHNSWSHYWFDDGDQYQLGQLAGTGGWSSWDDLPQAGNFEITDAQYVSGTGSVAIDGDDDAVFRMSGFDDGAWSFSTHQYVPGDMTGVQYLILLNTYEPGGEKNWSLQLEIDGAAGLIRDFDAPAAALPLRREEWANIRVEIDLSADLQTVYYGDEILSVKSWTNGASGGGAPRIEALDLWANGSAAPIYYDDFALQLIDQCPADVDHDGTVGFGDLLTVLSAWAQGGGAGDTNGDGMVDFLDLLDVLAAWGECG